MKNHYEILGLEPNASVEEIRQAYRKLSLKFHPDKNNGEAYFAAMFRQINEAYQILSDPAKRRAYDNQRFNSEQSIRQQQERIDQMERELRIREQALNKQTYEAEAYEPDTSGSIAKPQRLDYIIGLKYCLWAVIIVLGYMIYSKNEDASDSPYQSVGAPVVTHTTHHHRHRHHKTASSDVVQNADTIASGSIDTANRQSNPTDSVGTLQ